MHFIKVVIFLVITFTALPKILYCQEEKVTIKANRIFSDQINNKLIAVGNVEVNKFNQTLISDKIIYDKNTGWIDSKSDTKIIDLDSGNLFSNDVTMKDDFSKGNFVNPLLIFNDGTYLQSEKANRVSINKTTFSDPIYSICPNDNIVSDDRLVGNSFDLITLHSSKTTVDSDKQKIINKHAIVKISKVPVFYTPYISFPTRKNKRQTGFLTPSYLNNTLLGLGARTPYFINVAPNTNLTLTPSLYFDSNQTSINTNLEQKLKYGDHSTTFEISNNKISSTIDTNAQNRTESEYRYKIASAGNFEYTKDSSYNFNIHTIGDKDYLRDYGFNFIPYTESEFNHEYTKNRDYLKISTVRFQELELTEQRDQAQWVLPSVTHHIQSKPQSTIGEIYSLTSNATSINRESGLQYNRITTTPKVEVPFNLKGNLFNITLSNQIDHYYLEYNYDNATDRSSSGNLDKTQSNIRPLISTEWKLPLIKKSSNSTIIIEPRVKLTSSSSSRNYIKLPNEESNNSELTINNLFSDDRMSGYDRNENGERVSYGANSTIYTENSRFEFDIGQSYLINEESQDIQVAGFNGTNQSSIIGRSSYEYNFDSEDDPDDVQSFITTYNFHLDESNLSNKINNISSSLNLKKFSLTNEYLLIRRGVISDEKIAQDTLGLGYKITKKLQLSGSITKNLVTSKNLSRSLLFKYDGCCVMTEFSVTEANTSNLAKKQQSYNIRVIIRGL